MFLLSLFIYHENKKIKIYTIFFISLIIALFFMILDFIFIKNYPNIFEMPVKKSKKNKHEDELIDEIINEKEIDNEKEIIKKKRKFTNRKIVNNPYKIDNNNNFDYEENNIETIDNNNFLMNNQINNEILNQNNNQNFNDFEQTDPFDNVIAYNS